jgi:Toxin PAAR-like domain
MGVTVIVNSLSVVHKGSTGTATAAAPDACKTPSPGGPVPLPYPNIAMSSDLAMGTTTVSAEGNPIATKDAMFALSTGDEAGVAGGVVSNVIKGKAKFVNYSMDVKYEGANVARLGDPMTMNGNAPNTTTPAEVQANLGAALGQEVLDMLCKAFCWCNTHGGGGKAAGKNVVKKVPPGPQIA